jgi:hypothetical protein
MKEVTSVTTPEFEEHLNSLLAAIENQDACNWCGRPADEVQIDSNNQLCKRCQRWNREERAALQWQLNNPTSIRDEVGIPYELTVQFAQLCREEGQIQSWKGQITNLQLEDEFETLTERLLGGRDKIVDTRRHFAQFSSAQRRLLMYLLRRANLRWIQHRRLDFARDRTLKEFL